MSLREKMRPFIVVTSLVLVAGCDSKNEGSDGGTQPDEDGKNIDAGSDDTDTLVDSDGKLSNPLVVQIADGVLRGKSDGDTSCFLGIPYAKPPLGTLRWARPQKNDPWSVERDATQFGKRCAQLASTVENNEASEEEDCLYLNVWTPDTTPQKPMPVMFWIHGGANYLGSASEPLPYTPGTVFYSGRYLAEKYGVVVVSINYRLGVLGYLALPELASGEITPGNQGLWDQQLALQWVRDNIAEFGGDSNNVTIFGESAGSFNVCAHVASPLSRGLFHRAIGESGGCTTVQQTLQKGEAAAVDFASKLGCADVEDRLACLRGKSVSDLLAVVPVDGIIKPIKPIIDGEFLPEQPRELYDKGDIAKVPFILGTNTDEGTLFVYQREYPDEQAYRDGLARVFPQKPEDVALQYPISDYASPKAALARAIGDAQIVCPTFDVAQRAANAKLSVYMYNFDVLNPIVPELGAAHGAEISYVFGTSTRFTDENKAVSDLMQRYWTNLARSGDPNGGDDPQWPTFTDSDSNKRMNFSVTPSVIEDFRVDKCAFWQERYQETYDAER